MNARPTGVCTRGPFFQDGGNHCDDETWPVDLVFKVRVRTPGTPSWSKREAGYASLDLWNMCGFLAGSARDGGGSAPTGQQTLWAGGVQGDGQFPAPRDAPPGPDGLQRPGLPRLVPGAGRIPPVAVRLRLQSRPRRPHEGGGAPP